jgi:general secretion pathway protein L
MSAEGLTSRALSWLSTLDAGWRRWAAGFAARIPPGLRDWLDSGVAIVTIDLADSAVVLRRFADGKQTLIASLSPGRFDAASLRTALAPYLSRPWYLRESFALRLADAAALRRNLSLPLAARRDIASLLDIELERQSPLDRGEIYHDYCIRETDRRTGRLEVVWRIVRRKSVDPALAVCKQAGIDLAVVAFISDETPPDGGNFPVEAGASRLLRLRRWMVRGLLLLILALAIAVTAGVYSRNDEAATAFRDRVEAARIAALPSMRLAHHIAAIRQRAALLLQERQRLTVTRLLAETTRLLPDGTWLTDFSFRDGEVRIQGYSSAAPSLIALFDASPLFTGAEFRAPLTQAQSGGQEQFDLAFRLRKGAR